MLYALWDMGLKVGHSTRTVEECIKLAKADVTIRTAMLEGRLPLGPTALYDELERALPEGRRGGARPSSSRRSWPSATSARAHGRSAAIVVEPNVKDGKGGLRDLQTLFWIGKFACGARPAELVREGPAHRPASTAASCARARFLWTVRCHLHYLTGRAEERLTFDVQREMAARMGYADRAGHAAVERFMKRYFLAPRRSARLTALFLAPARGAAAEARARSAAPARRGGRGG